MLEFKKIIKNNKISVFTGPQHSSGGELGQPKAGLAVFTFFNFSLSALKPFSKSYLMSLCGVLFLYFTESRVAKCEKRVVEGSIVS